MRKYKQRVTDYSIFIYEVEMNLRVVATLFVDHQKEKVQESEYSR